MYIISMLRIIIYNNIYSTPEIYTPLIKFLAAPLP